MIYVKIFPLPKEVIMIFDANKSILYSDTLLPDIFVTEYMPSMDGDYVRIYIHCLFLSKHRKQDTPEEISKKLEIDMDKVKSAFVFFENIGLVSYRESSIVLTDLKDREINKIYRMKLTSSPDEAVLSSERNKKRNRIITAINHTFFQGVMSPSWYTDIDSWFDKYKFDEDVMMNLFAHCYEHKGLNRHYITKVAESWYNKNIKNSFDVEKYLEQYKLFKDMKGKIIKKLNLGRNLTEYEEEYVEKWVLDYKYGFEIIDLALKKTTAKVSPNFKYIHAILSDWYEKQLNSKEEIIAYEKSRKQAVPKSPARESAVPQKNNFEQRKYDDAYYESLYDNQNNKKTV